MKKQADFLSVIEAIRNLKFEVRNFKETKRGVSWNFSCLVCGDSVRDLKKARFGVTRKDGDFVCNCFNCGYANNFVQYLKVFHPKEYQKIVYESVQSENTLYDLNPLFGKLEISQLENIFWVPKERSVRNWVGILDRNKIKLSKSNLRKLFQMHKEYWERES